MTYDENLPECPNGCGIMHPDYDNVGFEPPEGVPHYELTGYHCPRCGAVESLDGIEEQERDNEIDE